MIDCMTCLIILSKGCLCADTRTVDGMTHGYVEAHFQNGCIENSSDPDLVFQALNPSGWSFRLCELNEYKDPPPGMLSWGARACDEVLFVKAINADR